jgi:hypothetical protein
MGNNPTPVLQTQQNSSNVSLPNSLKPSKPGSKTIFKYISPINVDETDEVNEDQENGISQQQSQQINEE